MIETRELQTAEPALPTAEPALPTAEPARPGLPAPRSLSVRVLAATWRVVKALLVAAALVTALVAIALPVLPRLLGWQVMIISTGSMTPTYPVGSLTLVRPISTAEIEVGTPLVFRSPRSPKATVTHRVVELIDVEGSTHFRTKGDANGEPDPALVPPQDVVGRVAYDVPLVGYAVDRLQSDPRLLMGLIAVPAGFVLVSETLTIRRSLRQERAKRAVADRSSAGGAA